MTPMHQTARSAGADLHSTASITIQPNECAVIGTGLYIADIDSPLVNDKDIFLLLANRSSIARKKKLILLNGVGINEMDYKEEIMCVYFNISGKPQTIGKGERIAQIIPMRFVPGMFDVKNVERSGGFGSTGS